MPLDPSELYGVNGSSYPASLIGFSGTTTANTNTVNVLLDNAKVFAHSSPSQRFFLAATPVSFCLNSNGQLERFQNYGNLTAQSSSLSAGDLLAQNLIQGDASNPVFRYSAGTLNRNALVDIRLTLRAQNEQFRLQHDVMLRNVP
jgi:MSHA biogenesis protein MshO